MKPQEIVLTLLANTREIQRVIDLIKPIIDAYGKVSPDLIPTITELLRSLKFIKTEKETIDALVWLDARWVQETLKLIGDPHIYVSGVLDDQTKRAVARFQSKHSQLVQDGWPGPKTCFALWSKRLELESKK